jgi:hypothetical protein
MVSTLIDLLTTVPVVTVVGLAALGLLTTDLVLRELAGAAAVPVRPRRYGLAVTAVFLVLVVLRFTSRGA